MSKRAVSTDQSPSMAPPKSAVDRLMSWLPLDVVALVAVYFVVDRTFQSMVELTGADLERPSLLAASIGHRWWVWVAVALVAAVVFWWQPERIRSPWSALEQGTALRLLTVPVVVMLVWTAAAYPVNFVAGQVHWSDRLLVVALGLAALWRPAFLLPLALQIRVVIEQTLIPFDNTVAANVIELPVLALLILGAGHLLFVVSGRHSTSPIILLMTALVATHFYIPGKGKMLMGWLAADDLANLPLSAHTAGWLGQTDGWWAEGLASFLDRFGPAVKVATLGLELGSLVALARRQLLQAWLIGAVLFHVITLAITGYFFLTWIVVEVGLLVVLSLPGLRAWTEANFRPPRVVVAVVAVLAGSVLFHPPGLAWFDAPIAYGYRIEAVGITGRTYHVPPSAFDPLAHHLTFSRLTVSDPGPVTGAYGVVDSSEQLELLADVNTIGELEDLERERAIEWPPDAEAKERSGRLLLDFFDSTLDGSTPGWWYRLRPPGLFWTGVPDPEYRFQEPLAELDLMVITDLHHGDRTGREETVLHIESDGDGGAVIEWTG